MRLSKSLLGAASIAALFPAGLASAQGLAAVGPTHPEHGFPEWYEDNNGLRLDACITDPVLCLLDTAVPVLVDPNLPFPANYGGIWPDHTFFSAAEATMPTNNGGQALLVITVQGGFVNDAGPVDGEQEVFARLRLRVDNLIAGSNYTVSTPVGIYNFVAANSGTRGINFTDDVGRGVPGVFTGALGGATGPFLMWDSGLPIVDANGREYLGNPTIDHTITGGQNGINFFRIQGPSVGGPGVNSIETNLFSVIGLKAQAPVVQAPVAAFNSAPNAGNAPLLVSFTDTSTGDVSARLWDFGDGATSTAQNPNHAYAAGTYTVSLTVTGPGGNDTETKVNLIAVADAPPPGGQLVLANPVPGTAGVQNSYVITGCTPGRTVGVYTGLQLGASVVNLGNCGGIPLGLARPFRLVGRAAANANGIATIVAGVPAGAAGRTFHAQAVEPFSCRTSNVVSEQF
jgi:PKD repeat protein